MELGNYKKVWKNQPEEKNKISHRGIAIQKLVDFLLNL